ncbi:MAG: preprotein translocase subunit YajC [Coriobacteriia bacterium]
MDTNTITFVLYIGLFFVFIYFMMIRPQQKQRKEHAQLIDSLTAGDEVVTAGGIHGRIKSVSEDTVELEVSPGVAITITRQAVVQKAED